MSDTIPPTAQRALGTYGLFGPSPDLSYWLTETLADAGLLLWRRARRQL
jgi:hypothetical protein